MIRSATLLWIVLAVVVAGALFRVSYRVQHLEKHLASVNKQIVQEQEAIHVLNAEWSYLNEPGRLEALVRKHLPLGPTTPEQMITLEQIPGKTVPPQAPTAGKPPKADTPAPVAPAQTPILANEKRGAVDD